MIESCSSSEVSETYKTRKTPNVIHVLFTAQLNTLKGGTSSCVMESCVQPEYTAIGLLCSVLYC